MKFSFTTAARLATVSICVLPGQLQAIEPEKTHTEHALEHVLVTVPIHRKEAETALPVTVLSGAELKASVASSIGETLADQPGLSNASFGPGVGQPVIRGQQGARVTVLQNSTTSADASNVSADHAVSVEPILAESIEVLRGPATLLYGGGAIGGVVNVIDRRVPIAVPEALRGDVELRHASVNDERVAVIGLDGGLGEHWAFHLDGVSRESNPVDIPGLAAPEEEETTDGYIGNSDAEMSSFTLGTSFIFERGYIGVAVSRLDNDYGIPPGGHGHHEEDHDDEEHGEEHDEEHEEEHDEEHEEEHHEDEVIRLDVEQLRYDLRADYHPELAAIDNLRWYLTHTNYQHTEFEGTEPGTRWSNNSWENRFELIHAPVAGWHGVVGLQLHNFELEALGDESFIPASEAERIGLFIVEDYHYQDWLFELGARWDRDEWQPDSATADDRSFNSVSLSASALKPLGEHWRLGLALSQSERAPVVEELYSNEGNAMGDWVQHVGRIDLGNPDLDSEQANNIDLTLSYDSEHYSGFITLFYNDFKDFIYLANTGLEQDEVLVLAYEQEDARFQGAEFALSTSLWNGASAALRLKLFGDWIQGELDNGEDIPRLPPLRLGSRLSLEQGPFNGFVSVLWAEEQDKPGVNEEPSESYTRWDAGMDYRFALGGERELLCFLKIKNISDEEIRLSTSFLREVAPEAGRSFELGARYSF